MSYTCTLQDTYTYTILHIISALQIILTNQTKN